MIGESERSLAPDRSAAPYAARNEDSTRARTRQSNATLVRLSDPNIRIDRERSFVMRVALFSGARSLTSEPKQSAAVKPTERQGLSPAPESELEYGVEGRKSA
jgi:hypothetical protein